MCLLFGYVSMNNKPLLSTWLSWVSHSWQPKSYRVRPSQWLLKLQCACQSSKSFVNMQTVIQWKWGLRVCISNQAPRYCCAGLRATVRARIGQSPHLQTADLLILWRYLESEILISLDQLDGAISYSGGKPGTESCATFISIMLYQTSNAFNRCYLVEQQVGQITQSMYKHLLGTGSTK